MSIYIKKLSLQRYIKNYNPKILNIKNITIKISILGNIILQIDTKKHLLENKFF